MPFEGIERLSTTERGYGWQHQQLRKKLLPFAVGTNCHRCKEPMLDPKNMHLDHDDKDRTRYLGFSHGTCNVKAGAAKAGRNSHNKKPRKKRIIPIDVKADEL
jgi:hypothetical protein